MTDIDPEGFYRSPDPLCACGPLYTYAGHIEPGQHAPDCPIHGNPKLFYDEAERLRAGIEALVTRCRAAWDEDGDIEAHGYAEDLLDLLDPTEGDQS